MAFKKGHKINVGRESGMKNKHHKDNSKVKTSLSVKESHKRKEYGFVKGHKSWLEGKAMDSKTKEKIKKSMKIAFNNPDLLKKLKEKRALQIVPTKDTSIEVKIQNFLKQLGIEFFTHQRMNIEHSYQCDILIPSMNLVIETDGNYWHKYPIGLELDKIRTDELIKKGFRVLRLWESEINSMKLNKFEEVLYG